MTPNQTSQRPDELQPSASPASVPDKGVADSLPLETASAFAHYLTQGVARISIQTQRVLSSLEKLPGGAPEQLQRDLHKLEDLAMELNVDFERFRNVVGRHPGVLRRTEVHQIITEVERDLSKRFASQVDLRLAGAAVEVLGDHELLWHLFANLIRNGLEAVQQKANGQVEVSTCIDTSRQIVSVVVRDNGIGMVPTALPRIFDPDYTTKPGHMGVGLYLVRRAVLIHGGQIECQSNLGEGTTFTLSLPVATRVPNETP